MKNFSALALSLSLLGTAAAEDRVARVGYLSWQDSGAYYEATLKGFREGLRSEPVELPSKFEVTLNSKTARALGVTIPRPVLLRADTVIE